jgi:Na+/melibiose symporter-like transporter
VFILLFYFGFAASGGLYSPAWIDFCAKTIPVTYRARTNAFRIMIAGAGGIVAPVLIIFFLRRFSFPLNYQLNILVGFILLFVSYGCFLMIRETTPSPLVRIKSLRSYFGSLLTVLRGNRNFVFFLITQVMLSVSECGAAFFTYYAIRQFSVGESTVVLYTLLLNLSYLGFGFVLGFLGDKLGNLQVLRIGALGTFLALVLVIVFPMPFTIYVVFVLVGINFNARLNSFQVFVTEFGDEKSRIRYTTLATAIGAASFGLMPLLGGILRETAGVSFQALFVVGAVFAFLAFLSFMFIVKDPRHCRSDIT